MFLIAGRADAQAFSTQDATYVAGTLPGLVPGVTIGPAIAYQNQGAGDLIPDTLCVFGVCLVNGSGGFVVRCNAVNRVAFAIQPSTGIWFRIQL